MRALSTAGFIVLLCGAAFSQAPAAKPVFDIADVHVSPRAEWAKDMNHTLQGGFMIDDRYELHRATLLDMIRIAWNADADKISGGPPWIDYDRFEVIARTRPGTRPASLRAMLQALLTDRFQLEVKTGTQPTPGYILSRGDSSLNLHPATDRSAAAGCNELRPNFDGGSTGPQITFSCRNITMDVLAENLRRFTAGLPVINSTGLEGAWDIVFTYRPRNLANDAPNATVIETLRNNGLELQKGTAPQPSLAIVRANEQPSPNLPGTAEALPALPPAEFEAASLRKCDDHYTGTLRFETGGRVSGVCVPLRGLIRDAWNLPLLEEPRGIPKWLDSAHNMTIEAKAPAGIAANPQNTFMARDILNTMLRGLLIDRYKMKVHYEDQPVDTFTLVAAKPKLTKADPARRTGCTRGLQARNGTRVTHLVCTNMTMAQLAEQIPAYDTDALYPVIDGTGIDGAWDFTIDYDSMASFNARFGRSGPVSPDGQAPDPTGVYSFAGAIEKQLGLKLQARRMPQPVLVIDHIEEDPGDN